MEHQVVLFNIKSPYKWVSGNFRINTYSFFYSLPSCRNLLQRNNSCSWLFNIAKFPFLHSVLNWYYCQHSAQLLKTRGRSTFLPLQLFPGQPTTLWPEAQFYREPIESDKNYNKIW